MIVKSDILLESRLNVTNSKRRPQFQDKGAFPPSIRDPWPQDSRDTVILPYAPTTFRLN